MERIFCHVTYNSFVGAGSTIIGPEIHCKKSKSISSANSIKDDTDPNEEMVQKELPKPHFQKCDILLKSYKLKALKECNFST